MSKHMLVLELECPNCADRLTEGSKVRLNAWVRDTNEDGEVRLSAIFGDYGLETDLVIPEGAIVSFRCPTCDQDLAINTACRVCAAPMVSLNLCDGGYLEFCSRRGCTGHALGGAGDVDAMIGLVNRMMNTPHD